MQLEIPKDVEASFQAKAAAAGFQTVEEYILDRLALDQPTKRIPGISHEQWLDKLNAMVERIESQPNRDTHLDDSRESIYPVR